MLPPWCDSLLPRKLTSGCVIGPFQSVVDGSIADGKTTTSIRRTELATWLLRNALAERAELVRQMPLVSTSAKAPGSTE